MKTRAWLKPAASFTLYNVGWLACAWWATRMPLLAVLGVAVVVVIHALWPGLSKRDLRVGVIIGLMGSIIDSLLGFGQVLSFAWADAQQTIVPIWLFALWVLFGVSAVRVLANTRLSYLWLCLLGAIAGPLAYVAGHNFGATVFVQDMRLTVGILVLVWAVLLPLLVWYTRFTRR